MEAMIRPMPIPEIRLPTKYNTFIGKVKKPTPNPNMTPPPMARDPFKFIFVFVFISLLIYFLNDKVFLPGGLVN